MNTIQPENCTYTASTAERLVAGFAGRSNDSATFVPFSFTRLCFFFHVSCFTPASATPCACSKQPSHCYLCVPVLKGTARGERMLRTKPTVVVTARLLAKALSQVQRTTRVREQLAAWNERSRDYRAVILPCDLLPSCWWTLDGSPSMRFHGLFCDALHRCSTTRRSVYALMDWAELSRSAFLGRQR